MHTDPSTEWSQIFNETRHITRVDVDAANHHGVDWEGVMEKLQPVPALHRRQTDLKILIRRIASEL
ncbi:MAG: hypothetical protein MUP13_14160 [Thermoanaerobaculales bacterium]|nr:hypothetical protein [Thermoanaerobaculales bacterium]